MKNELQNLCFGVSLAGKCVKERFDANDIIDCWSIISSIVDDSVIPYKIKKIRTILINSKEHGSRKGKWFSEIDGEHEWINVVDLFKIWE